MAVYRRRSRIAAPFDEVWAFHDGVDGLRALTPRWFDLQVETVHGPDGEPDPAVLEVGSEIQLSMRPFGVGPRQQWTSRIVDRESGASEAFFRDVMVEGLFPHWVHTHTFRADGEETVVTDRVEYELPVVPGALAGLAKPFFAPLFAYRHRTLERRLSGG